VNTDTHLALGRRRVRRGALAVLSLALVALVAAACANAVGSPRASLGSSLPALRSIGGAAGGAARLVGRGASSGTTNASALHAWEAETAAVPATQDEAVTAAVQPAGDPAPAAPIPAPVPLPGIAPPTSLSDTCAQDVSAPMQNWLTKLPAGTIVRAPVGACYLVDEGLKLVGLKNITIIGGTWEDKTVPVANASPDDMGAVFWFVGGSGINVQNLFVSGVNTGGYDAPGAFAAGIRSDGVDGLTVTNLFVDHVYADGVTLDPLRASNDLSSTIVRPSENVVLHNVWVDGAGRQGVTLASVNGATMSGLVFIDIGMDVFDIEADQWDEGAQNVTVDGCTVRGDVGGLFFANGGAGSGGPWTSNVSVEGCTMLVPLAGYAVFIDNVSNSGSQRGPFTFSNDVLRCGSSASVSCIEVSNGNLTVTNSFLRVPPGTIHEPVYASTHSSTVVFDKDVVAGYGSPGTSDNSSSTTVQGGSWTPYGGASGSPPSGSTTTTSPSSPGPGSGKPTTTTAPPHATTSTTSPPRSTTSTAGRSTTTTTAPLLPLLSGGSGSTKTKR
jgi:hypothetical protein